MKEPTRRCSPLTVRSADLRSSIFRGSNTDSIGLRSGEYCGKYRSFCLTGLDCLLHGGDLVGIPKPAAWLSASNGATLRNTAADLTWPNPNSASWPRNASTIPDRETLVEEVVAWQRHRNRNHAKANWHFTTQNAPIKLKRLYPSL